MKKLILFLLLPSALLAQGLYRPSGGSAAADSSVFLTVTAGNTLVGPKMDSTRVNALRGSDTTRAVVREAAKMDSVRVNALRGEDTTRAIVREGSRIADSLDANLLTDATAAVEYAYIHSDSLKSRAAYVSPCWTLDSTVMALYGTRFSRTWFRTGADSLAVDSLSAVLSGANTDTVTFRVRWGTDRTAAVDSLSDLKCYSLTVATGAKSTKVIPPYNFVWLALTEKDGAPVSASLMLDCRRRWKP